MVYSTQALLLRCSALTLFALVPIVAQPAHAQEPQRGASPLNLPRQGYEPRLLHLGSTTVALEAQMGGLYDDNVYAAETAKRDDIILTLVPQAQIDTDLGKVQLHSRFQANVREHTQENRESSTAFSLGSSLDYSISRANSLSARVQFDRVIENRADPEAAAGLIDPPRKINNSLAELNYGWHQNRLGIEATATVQRYNYLSPLENNRDMRVYRGSLRASLKLAAPMDVFVEGYVNRRDFDRTAFDGISRNATTVGVLAGISRELSERWHGSVGVGFFHSDPSDPSLSGFSGLGANGNITWNPRPRTAVTAQVFRGDVATVRTGASGRTDTRFSLGLDQEVRHNVLLSAGISYRDTIYRGLSIRNQKLLTGDVEAQYLLNRFVSLYASAGYTRRTSRFFAGEFNRSTVGLGLRLRY